MNLSESPPKLLKSATYAQTYNVFRGSSTCFTACVLSLHCAYFGWKIYLFPSIAKTDTKIDFSEYAAAEQSLQTHPRLYLWGPILVNILLDSQNL